MKPLVRILNTGGTIACRIGESGVPVMDFQLESLLSQIRALGVEVHMESVMRKCSSDIGAGDWQVMARAAATALREGVNGVVITHGTDIMHYTAAALSFMLRDLSVPVVMTGSIIPADQPGSDALPNLVDAIRVAAFANIAEVCIVFSADSKRSRGVIIRGCRGKKIHSNAINAFASINFPPLGYVKGGCISQTQAEARRRAPRKLRISTNLDCNVILIKLIPGLTQSKLTAFLAGASGAVLEGTGTGHIPPELLKAVASFGRPVVMSTQAVYGGERLGLYDIDKTTLDTENIIPGRDMTGETALVKLMWALKQDGDKRSIMLTNICGELSEESASTT